MSVHLHDVLNGFHARGGTGTAILKLNMAQDLASVDQDSLFLVFLDMQKTYDNIYPGILLTMLEGYSAGLPVCRILETFWEQQEVITH